MVSSLLKIIFFLAIIVIGIICISDNLIAKIGDIFTQLGDSARGVIGQRLPGITRDFGQQFDELKTEVGKIGDNISNFFWNNIKNWISSRISEIKLNWSN
jgi:predicted PurR-regulated permease PerM